MAESPGINGSKLVTFTVYVNNSKLNSEYRVESIFVQKEFNRIPYAKISIIDGDMPNKDFPISNKNDFKPGTEIKIDAGYDSTETTIFQGIIVKIGIKITNDNTSNLLVECKDKVIKLTLGRKNANYVKKKDSDIITSIIGNCSGLSSDVKATSITYNELVQYYCTDWDFILSRSEINGFIVNIDNGKLTIKPPATGESPKLTITYGDDLIDFDAEIDSQEQLKSVEAVGWDTSSLQVVKKTGSAPTLNKQGNLTASTLSDVLGLAKFNLQTMVPLDKDLLKNWADAQLLKTELSKIKGTMRFQGNSNALPGTIIELKGVGERFSGNVFVNKIEHNIENGDWITETGFGFNSDWFIEKYETTAPTSAGLLPGVEGLQIGIVMKLDGDPDNQNKIQVKIPVMQAETEGVWARISNFYASNGFGDFFIPEIGDEVILGFFNNDPCHPVILGSLYSSKNVPPYQITKDNFKKAIVTKTKMKIEFDEEKKIITIITPGKNQIVINDDQKSILLKDQNNNSAELCSDGIKLDSPKDITISAKGKVAISAIGQITIDSKQDVKVSGLNVNNEAKVGFVAKGNATAELSASGQTTVKGAMVMIN